MRPIDADALIEKCGGWYVDECTESGFIGTLENLLATEPTIQPQSTTGQLNDGARSTAQSTDLIDRQAAIDGKIIIQRTNGVEIYYDEAVPVGYLKRLPPAQPEPHEGHWIDKGCNGDWAWQIDGRGNCWRVIECSECGKRVLVESNYCPHCGAKMSNQNKIKGERQK